MRELAPDARGVMSYWFAWPDGAIALIPRRGTPAEWQEDSPLFWCGPCEIMSPPSEHQTTKCVLETQRPRWHTLGLITTHGVDKQKDFYILKF